MRALELAPQRVVAPLRRLNDLVVQRLHLVLHNKVIQAAKRKDDTLRRQFQRAQALTFPQGHPQEREVGFVWFLNRYGPALVDRLMDELPLAMGHHWVLTI